MTTADKERLKTTIKEEIELLTQDIFTLENQLRPIKKDCTLDNAAHHSLKLDQNITIQRYEEAKKRLNRLKSAYLKIDTKEYGVCKECEEEISLERLKLIPESLYCVDCMNELGL